MNCLKAFWDSLTSSTASAIFFFFLSMTLKLSIKLVLSCLVSHLLNKFKVSNFDWHWRTVAWVWTDFCNFTSPVFYAVTDHRKDQISSHNSYPTFCWVNLEDFLTLGTLYCLISVTRGNIVCIDTGTYDRICISFTPAIRYIDVSVNRYTPNRSHNVWWWFWKLHWAHNTCFSLFLMPYSL